MAFVTYNPSTDPLTSLVSAFFTGSAGAALVNGSITVRHGVPPSEASTISFYDGALAPLKVGAGLLLTPGDPTPPEINTTEGHTVELLDDTSDPDLLATATVAYHGVEPLDGVRDVTWLQFQVNITDPALVGMSVDVVFGSEEYLEYVEHYPDVAGVYVNGVNYALFNNSLQQPLAVLNATADKFQDNRSGALPIEYDGVTDRLQVTAPVHLGVNTIKIGIADTGWYDYDSGLFVSGMQAVQYAGFGMAQRVALTDSGQVTDAASNQVYVGNAANNRVLLTGGLDVVDGGAGVDQVTYSPALGAITGGSWNGKTLKLSSGSNASELVNVERVSFQGGPLFALDTQIGGNTYSTYALLQATFNTAPSTGLLSQWLAVTDAELAQGHNMGDVSQRMLDHYAPGVSNETFVAYLFHNITGSAASPATVSALASQVGSGRAFDTMGDLFAAASLLSLNTDEMAGVVGSLRPLDPAFFA